MVKDVTLYCQNASEATAEGGMNKIVLLLTDTLEPTGDLVVEHVPVIGAAGADASASAEGADASASGARSRTKRSHADLTQTGRATREAFATAIAKRFLPRYTPEGLRKHPHLFDQVMLLSPKSRKMKYMDKLVTSSAAQGRGLASAAAIKARVVEEVVSLTAEAVTENRRRSAAARAVDDSTTQRTRTPQDVADASENLKRLEAAGMIDSDSDDGGGGGQVQGSAVRERSPDEEAKAIVDDWTALKVGFRGRD